MKYAYHWLVCALVTHSPALSQGRSPIKRNFRRKGCLIGFPRYTVMALESTAGFPSVICVKDLGFA